MSAAKQSAAPRRTASDKVVPALLRAAEIVLDRDGEKGVTIRAVAGEAGVAPMGVYNRFGNREGLLIALAVRAFTELARSIAASDSADPEQRFREMCWGYREFANAYPQRYALIFSTGSPVKFALAQEASERGNEAFAQLVDAVAGLAVSQHSIAHVEGAQIVWNALHGAVTIESAQLARSANAEETFELMITVLLNGLRAAQ